MKILLTLFLINCSFAFAQLPSKDIIPLSPDAAQLGIFGAVPVGLFTGTIQQSIPIYEFKTQNLSVPITLNYSSNGLIVDKVASWVGFDWSLDAGGAITCNVKGKSDYRWGRSDVPEGIEGNPTVFLNYLESHFFEDQQPDIFSFTLPGNGGKFFLKYDGKQAYTIPFQKLKIETTRPDGNMTKGDDFIITTPDGIKYVFDKEEVYYGATEYYPVTWYLSSITHPAGDIINFYYTQPAFASYYPGVSQQISRFLYKSGEGGTTPTDPEDNAIAHSTNIQSMFLDSIKSTGYGTVIFQKTGNRTDNYNGQRLNQVIIKNSKNQPIKNIQLEYHYVENSFNFSIGSGINFTGSTGNNPNIQNELKYRMFLDAVYFKDSQNKIISSYKFDYLNLDNLPPRLSFSQDHWGFFNGAYNNYLTPASAIPSEYAGKFPTNIICNREANGQYSQNGVMSKITYPTGGYSIMEYEPHNNGTQDIGGLRVKRVTTYENASSVPVVKRYYYPNCYGRGVPSSYYTFKSYGPSYAGGVTNYHGVIVSSSLYSIYNSDQGSAVYPTVKVSYGENYEGGGELHSFNVTTDVPALPANPVGGGSIVPISYSNVAWYNGTKSSETIFKKNSLGQFVNVKSTSYIYNRTDSRYNTDYNAMAIVKNSPPYFPHDPLSAYAAFKYRVYSTWNKPSSTTETVYDDSGNAVLNETAYSYDDLNKGHAQLSREIMTKSNGETITKKYFYPGDYTTTSYNIGTLISKHIVNAPLDIRKYDNNSLAEGLQIKYNAFGQKTNVLMAETSGTDIIFSPSNPYTFTPRATYLYNDINHNVMQINGFDGITTSYLWSYNGSKPVVKGDNVTYDILNAAVNAASATNLETFWSGFNDIATNTSQQTAWKNFNTALRNNTTLANALVTTYTYSPLKGMTSQTAPNGTTTYYLYDSFGRLSEVKNDDGKLLKKHKYRYATN